ncbi:MAG: hypothetical protein ACI9CF_002042 [Candidatus Omnitrophota bacterium]|jgi:hypothetical protein
MRYMRIWQNVDIDSIKERLLIVGELSADCAACRELGIVYQETKICPGCGVDFKFITARGAIGSLKVMGGTVKRIKDRRPDLTFIDYDDYKSITGKQSAADFFGD